MTLITTTQALSALCERLRRAEFVTVDTEFMREKTYFSRLCLVQLAGPDEAAAIDPLAEGMDLAPLHALLADPNVLKVFHAARQDVEIFFEATGRVPTPLFDTQIAAMVCGFGEQVSYQALAAALAKARIDKSSRFTDWSHRPLSEKQIDYALGDVTHLRTVYEKLKATLHKTGRAEWVAEEMAALADPETYRADPQEAWKRIKLRTDKPRARAVLRELAAWRDGEARRADIPRSRLLKDEALAEIACHPPADEAALSRMRGLPHGFAQSRHGKAILEAVSRALALPPEDCPPDEDRRVELPRGAGAVLELLRVLLKSVSEAHDVAPRLLASAEELERLAAAPFEQEPDIRPLKGWRRDLFGLPALALKRGQTALVVQKGKVTTVPV